MVSNLLHARVCFREAIQEPKCRHQHSFRRLFVLTNRRKNGRYSASLSDGVLPALRSRETVQRRHHRSHHRWGSSALDSVDDGLERGRVVEERVGRVAGELLDELGALLGDLVPVPREHGLDRRFYGTCFARPRGVGGVDCELSQCLKGELGDVKRPRVLLEGADDVLDADGLHRVPDVIVVSDRRRGDVLEKDGDVVLGHLFEPLVLLDGADDLCDLVFLAWLTDLDLARLSILVRSHDCALSSQDVVERVSDTERRTDERRGRGCGKGETRRCSTHWIRQTRAERRRKTRAARSTEGSVRTLRGDLGEEKVSLKS